MRHRKHENLARIDHIKADSINRTTTQKKKKKRYLFFSQTSHDLGEDLVRSQSNLWRSWPIFY